MAPPPNTPSDKPLTLHARYQAPPSGTSNSDIEKDADTTASASASAPQHHLFTHPIPSSLSLNRGTGTNTGADSPTNRTAYLSDLRTAVSTMQGEINVFLTARMEEDNARLAAQGDGKSAGGGGRDAREEKEEENYGEEVVDDE